MPTANSVTHNGIYNGGRSGQYETRAFTIAASSKRKKKYNSIMAVCLLPTMLHCFHSSFLLFPTVEYQRTYMKYIHVTLNLYTHLFSKRETINVRVTSENKRPLLLIIKYYTWQHCHDYSAIVVVGNSGND